MDSREIALHVRQVLKESKLDRKKLAKLLGYSEESVQELIDGKTEWSIEELQVLADICNVTLELLVKGQRKKQGL